MISPLPDFSAPPVVEVALSVQFERLIKLHTVNLGTYWQQFKSQFPITEEHPPLDAVIERFETPLIGKAKARFELSESLPAPRCWFLNDSRSELIQVQQDRFAHNWIKGSGDLPYPRYESVRRTFEIELNRFRKFVDDEKLGMLSFNQCEITYVNHIVAGKTWGSHGEVDRILTIFSSNYSDTFLSSPQDASARTRYIIPNELGQPIGRLHVNVKSGYRNSDRMPIYILELTARGRPASEEIEGVLGFLDIGREWIVRGFASLTTPTMHKEWGRTDGA